MPFVTTTTRFPPPSIPLLLPNPLAAIVTPGAPAHRQRREQKGVLVAFGGDSLPDDNAAIIDRFRPGQDAEIARRKIAKHVEIKHLPVRVKKSVVGAVAHG
jgi:hypothetical protein